MPSEKQTERSLRMAYDKGARAASMKEPNKPPFKRTLARLWTQVTMID